jgi:anaerobic magnesium-protoporphyrin IX monomethyl ester cyclase
MGWPALRGRFCALGNETVILDYGTVQNIRRMMPEEVSAEARRIFASVASKLETGRSLDEDDVGAVAQFDRRLHNIGESHSERVAEEICDEIGLRRPGFVGFKLWNGDGFWGSIRIANEIRKRHKNVRLFAGGPHVDVFMENIFRATDIFDCLAYGEGEETILQLCEFVEGKRPLQDVDNVIFRNDSGHIQVNQCKRVPDLNTLPFPCYQEEIYPSMKGDQKIKILVMDESRGCRYSCYFCIHPVKSGHGMRCKSAERVVEEMHRAHNQLGIRAFRYAGSSTPPSLAKEIAERILGENLDVEYSGFGNFIDAVPQDYPILAKSGCRSLAFGMESGSERILKDAMGKPLRLEKMRRVLEATRKANIFNVVAVIFPAPFETKETESETLAFIRDARPDSIAVLFPALYPGTKWANEKERFGFDFKESEYLEAAMNYKMRLLFPMDFWDDLPYSLSGREFRSILKETARLNNVIENDGIVTSLTDDFVLTAALAGYRGQEKKLRDLGRMWFFTGDAESVQEFVTAVNQRAVRGAQRAGESPMRGRVD